MFVIPTPADLAYVDGNGNKIDPKTVGGAVHLTNGVGVPAATPWVEIKGVKGPDGVARTLYRTGDGSANTPFLFHELPPTDATHVANAAGQVVVPVKVGVDG